MANSLKRNPDNTVEPVHEILSEIEEIRRRIESLAPPLSGKEKTMDKQEQDEVCSKGLLGGHDPCEWHPGAGRPAYDNEVHAQATFVVGAKGQWRLCNECSKLPQFSKYRSRKPINKVTPNVKVTGAAPEKG